MASKSLLTISYLEDDGIESGFRYKLNCEIWDNLWPIYDKYGTSYKLNWDLSGPEWDDYDEDGVPYWEKWDLWDYEDEETGDAFRIIEGKTK